MTILLLSLHRAMAVLDPLKIVIDNFPHSSVRKINTV